MINVEPCMLEPVYLFEAGVSNVEIPDGSDDNETGAKPATAGEWRLTLLDRPQRIHPEKNYVTRLATCFNFTWQV